MFTLEEKSEPGSYSIVYQGKRTGKVYRKSKAAPLMIRAEIYLENLNPYVSGTAWGDGDTPADALNAALRKAKLRINERSVSMKLAALGLQELALSIAVPKKRRKHHV